MFYQALFVNKNNIKQIYAFNVKFTLPKQLKNVQQVAQP